MLEQIKIDLPNFPDEIIKDWLEPYANDEDIGWPPTLCSRWQGILSDKTLEFWKTVMWEKQSLDVTVIDMSAETNEALVGMHEAFVLEKENIYSRKIMDGKKRYMNALSYLFEYGVFPKPICLIKENASYSIVDGNHRVVAWKMHGDIMNILHKISGVEKEKFIESLKTKWGIETPAEFSSIQEVWVACIRGNE